MIAVREYRPAAILALADPAAPLYYVAGGGRIFATVEAGDSHDLPYVTGLRAADLTGADAAGPRAIRRALALLRLTARGQAGIGVASEVHIDAAHGLTLVAERPRVPIELGWSRFEEKLAHVGVVLGMWAGREPEMVSVRCTNESEVIVRTRAAAPKPAGRSARRPTRA